MTLGIVILIWSLMPVYNMLLIALDRDEGDIEFEGIIWPPEPSLHSFQAVVTQSYWLVEDFWRQFGNSFFIGLMTMFLTVVIGSLASFAFGRMRLSKGGCSSTLRSSRTRSPRPSWSSRSLGSWPATGCRTACGRSSRPT